MLAGRLKIAIKVQSMEWNTSVLPTLVTLDILLLFFSKHAQIYAPVCQSDADFSSWRMEHQLSQIF